MKDGYYYFKSLDNKAIDKSFGYISFTISADRHLLYFQCSLNKEKINNISSNRYPLELYLSPVTYITNTSLFLGKFSSFQKNRLFMDSSVSFLQSDFKDENLYVIVTAGGRTILFSEIHSKAITTETSIPQISEEFGFQFDPFNTTNSSYKWFIHTLKAHGDATEIFRKIHIHPEMFAKVKVNGANFMPDTFIRTAHYALRVAGHILRGEYTDPESGRSFVVVGLPGWNIRTKKRQALTIRIYARWITAVNKPPEINSNNYNGYWLYYFDRESGNPVKAVLKKN